MSDDAYRWVDDLPDPDSEVDWSAASDAELLRVIDLMARVKRERGDGDE